MPPARCLHAAMLAVLGVGHLMGAGRLGAHDIPATVVVQVFAKPEGERLRLLIRVPLEAMRDIQWPLRGPGYLEIALATPLLGEAARLWILNAIELYEGDRLLDAAAVLAARVSLPSDRSFASYEQALRHVTGAPLPETTELMWQQALLDVVLEYPIASDESRFTIRPGLAHLGLRTTTVLRFLPPGRGERAFQYVGDPGRIHLDPRWHQAAASFVRLGSLHILEGMDHLLFVVCLVIPFRRLRPLIAIVTSFTVAHSVTLVAAALGFVPSALWFPLLVETLIALSILYMAVENIVGANLHRRWMVAFGFGLVHGFGFSFALRESLQFAGAHLATSLAAFNLGVELGQIVALVVSIPVLELLFRRVVTERLGTILLSALVAHSAWHWMVERWSSLRQYRVQWPSLDLLLAARAVQVLLALVILVGIAWAVKTLVGRVLQGDRSHEGALPTSGGGSRA